MVGHKKYNKAFVSENSTLMEEWNYNKNTTLNPNKLHIGTPTKAWWKCKKCGYEWETQINLRQWCGCPKCSKKGAVEKLRKTILQNKKSLAEEFPKLKEEWNYEKNEGLLPENITSGSDLKVWWICMVGHEWQATINSRTRGSNCPICHGESSTSFAEQAILFYITKYFENVLSRFKLDGLYELDIYIPQINVALEYDGMYYHTSKKAKMKEEEKNKYCRSKGIRLIRIKETNKGLTDKENIIYCKYDNDYNYLKLVVEKIFALININHNSELNVDISKDKYYIREQYILSMKKSSLATLYPELLEEWNYEKNGNIKPEFVSYGSGQKYWWKCKKCGYEWEQKIVNRTQGYGCPACTNKVLVKGFNDLATKNSELAKQWDYKKNGNITPSDVFSVSSKKVWWKCEKGHSYMTSISLKTRNIKGCPICNGKQILVGYNDLQSTNPNLIKQWDYEKNILKPTDITVGSNKAIWWKCEKGHSWKSPIWNRVNGSGCPYCINQKVKIGYNDVLTTNPELKTYWNYDKNSSCAYSSHSGKKVWWKCPNCHYEWQEKVINITNGDRCPVCSNHIIIKGVNDLFTTNPELKKYWDFDKNTSINPYEQSYGSKKVVWWKCEKGHSWKTSILIKAKGSKCLICSNRVALVGYNDLFTIKPYFSKIWDYSSNELDPKKITFGSAKIANFKCPICNYKWAAKICNQKALCPKCKNKILF